MSFKMWSLLTVSSVVTACATSSSTYTPPSALEIVNSKFVQKPFEEVWDGLVKQLSSDFFVINNIDKNSRLINLSFSSQRPSDFVDCGLTKRTFSNAGKDQSYSYKTVDSATFVTTNTQGLGFNVRRSSRLEGRTNIYVAPEKDGTNVTINTKYVVSINITAIDFNGRAAPTQSLIFDPSTKQSYSDGDVTCFAIGTIEERILRAAR